MPCRWSNYSANIILNRLKKDKYYGYRTPINIEKLAIKWIWLGKLVLLSLFVYYKLGQINMIIF